ncbi:Protein kinase domain-containing protein [Heracleum sosnowskyi]|uniref:non-specific serine/threonine protein kinase n=1 Tax=Heracleum sosnowskyi TaxID=360622 RepID=A0AAD8HAJ4_9APIA|nr:Protein kinase domain-containing protein [Heracleum sosnowskyi]
MLVVLYICLLSIGNGGGVSSSSLSPDGQTLLTLAARWILVPSSITTTWINHNNNTDSPCSWVGVVCNKRQHVEALNLSSFGISGTLGPEFESLSYLTSIDLSYNYFFGSIPPQLGNCSLLSTLDLSSNSLSGHIPPTLANLNRLLYLAAYSNSLTANIPRSLFQIPTLQIIYLNDNKLSGPIPSSIGNMTDLIYLYLDTNNLSGTIPSSIANCTKLQDLMLSANQLTGTLPKSFNYLRSLVQVDFHSNNLQGSIPFGSGSSCRLLEVLDLSFNSFVGLIPPELGNCTSLTMFAAVSSGITGHIPSSIGQLSDLTTLSLSQNLLSGNIPPELGQCRSLIDLELYSTKLEGELPSELGMLSELEKLYLFENQLTGEIPSGIWKIETLIELHLYSNHFTGEIPLLITKLKHLRNFTVYNNRFSGIIPQGLGINSSLEVVDFTNNTFTGQIPPNLCFKKKLRRLTLGSNYFEGSIPSDIGSCTSLERLILEQNNLSGILPQFVKNAGLVYMDLNNNRISGKIPASLRNLTNITSINFSLNKLTGLIPQELGDLIHLQTLNLSRNDFEGPLPSQLSNCKRLLHFDVSYNHLNGSISSSFRSMARLAHLVLSGNHFTDGLPPFLFDLENLLDLQLGENLLGGEFPALIRSAAALRVLNALNLSSNGLSGNLPAEMGNFLTLEILDVSSNNLTGTLDALSSLRSLINVNVSYNLFTGAVPTTLMKLLSSSPSSFMGNLGLCANCLPTDGLTCNISRNFRPCDNTLSSRKGIGKVQIAVIALATSLFAVFAFLALGYLFLQRRNLEQEAGISAEEGASSLLQKVMEATENLNEKYIIGSGAHGTVYKVLLDPEKVYAVKKLMFTGMSEGHMSMVREIQTIGKVKHRNLVKLEQFWLRKDYGLILYNYMQNGSLYDVLHVRRPPAVLEWNTRYQIALGTAHGLAYLHFDTDPAIVHRDIKPMNILLDFDMEPHISDFGIAKILDQSSASVASTTVQGTIGYIAPENAFTTTKSKESDVYSYGVVLLELLTRKKALDPSFPEGQDIVSWVASRWSNTEEIIGIIDPSLLNEVINSGIKEQVTGVLLVALRCTEKEASKRLSMREVVKQLEDLAPLYRIRTTSS